MHIKMDCDEPVQIQVALGKGETAATGCGPV
jgi:hypothetical protein